MALIISLTYEMTLILTLMTLIMTPMTLIMTLMTPIMIPIAGW